MNSRSSIFATLVGVCALSAAAFAQMAPMIYEARVQVRPDRAAEYRDIEKQYSEAFKKGGGEFRYVFQGTLGNPYEFLVLSSLPNYAALDSEKSPYAKGLAEGDLARLSARRSQCTESVRTSIHRRLPEQSIVTAGAPMPKYLRMTRLRVQQGKADQFMAMIKDDMLPALKQAGVKMYRVRRAEYGASRNEFVTVYAMEKFGELDEQSALAKALGPDGFRKWLEKSSAIVAYSEYLVYTVRPELSWIPAAP